MLARAAIAATTTFRVMPIFVSMPFATSSSYTTRAMDAFDTCVMCVAVLWNIRKREGLAFPVKGYRQAIGRPSGPNN